MIFRTRGFGREFLYPQLHHVMDFPLAYNSFIRAPVLTKDCFALANKYGMIAHHCEGFALAYW